MHAGALREARPTCSQLSLPTLPLPKAFKEEDTDVPEVGHWETLSGALSSVFLT